MPQPQKTSTGLLHHVELWVPDLARATTEWGWLLGELGYLPETEWAAGRSWRLGVTYLVIEQSPALTADTHDRCRPGLNHLAFHVRDSDHVESLVGQSAEHGWTLMFPDRHPHAGGPQQYAGYLENTDGFEVELVAPLARKPGEDVDPAWNSHTLRDNCHNGYESAHKQSWFQSALASGNSDR